MTWLYAVLGVLAALAGIFFRSWRIERVRRKAVEDTERQLNEARKRYTAEVLRARVQADTEREAIKAEIGRKRGKADARLEAIEAEDDLDEIAHGFGDAFPPGGKDG